MVRAKFKHEIVRGVNRRQSHIQRKVHGQGPKKGKNSGKKFPSKDVKGYVKKTGRKKKALHLVKATKPVYWDMDQQRNGRKRTKRNTKKKSQTKLRPSITPGTIVILLAGPLKGKKAVYLKQLSSGLMLITGPYYANGIPLRRANQAYVIATSTKLDLKDVDLKKLDEVDDSIFSKRKAARKKVKELTKEDKDFFATATKKYPSVIKPMDDYVKYVDKALKPVIGKIPNMKRYLNTKFRLQNKTYPHLMKF